MGEGKVKLLSVFFLQILVVERLECVDGLNLIKKINPKYYSPSRPRIHLQFSIVCKCPRLLRRLELLASVYIQLPSVQS